MDTVEVNDLSSVMKPLFVSHNMNELVIVMNNRMKEVERIIDGGACELPVVHRFKKRALRYLCRGMVSEWSCFTSVTFGQVMIII